MRLLNLDIASTVPVTDSLLMKTTNCCGIRVSVVGEDPGGWITVAFLLLHRVACSLPQVAEFSIYVRKAW